MDEYKKGFLDGIECFAYYINGEQLVGTAGLTLKEAKQRVTTLWNYANLSSDPPARPEDIGKRLVT